MKNPRGAIRRAILLLTDNSGGTFTVRITGSEEGGLLIYLFRVLLIVSGGVCLIASPKGRVWIDTESTRQIERDPTS